MDQTSLTLPEIKLIGITARTNNQAEMQGDKAKIGAIIAQYDQQKLAEQILHRKKPGVAYCVYTEYESNHLGDYTYFVGEEVESFDNQPDSFTKLTIPAQNYIKFTTESGPMPMVCIKTWQGIWANEELEAKRSYIADFEIYDQRAADPLNTILDIYIGVR